MPKTILRFLCDTSGAVTVDWVVLAASVVGLGVASVGAVRTGTGALGADIGAALEDAFVAGNNRIAETFDDVSGLPGSGPVWAAQGSFAGWTALGAIQTIEVVQSGYIGGFTPDGGNWISMDADPGNIEIGRTIDARPGEPLTLSFNAVDPRGGDPVSNNGVDVYFGGVLVGHANPTSMTATPFDFALTGGMGDGSNQLVLVGTGAVDSSGAWIHGVSVR